MSNEEVHPYDLPTEEKKKFFASMPLERLLGIERRMKSIDRITCGQAFEGFPEIGEFKDLCFEEVINRTLLEGQNEKD